MITDLSQVFDFDVALTGTRSSTATLNLGAAGDAEDRQLVLEVITTDGLASAGKGAVLTVSIVVGATSSPATTLLVTGAIAEASITTAGSSILQINLPRGLLQYIQLIYTVSTENFTSGHVRAFLTTEPQTQYNH